MNRSLTNETSIDVPRVFRRVSRRCLWRHTSKRTLVVFRFSSKMNQTCTRAQTSKNNMITKVTINIFSVINFRTLNGIFINETKNHTSFSRDPERDNPMSGVDKCLYEATHVFCVVPLYPRLNNFLIPVAVSCNSTPHETRRG